MGQEEELLRYPEKERRLNVFCENSFFSFKTLRAMQLCVSSLAGPGCGGDWTRGLTPKGTTKPHPMRKITRVARRK